jgi:toxin ParE1/3/4
MNYRILFHPRAEQDLIDLHRYIQESAGTLRALAYLSALKDFCMSLATFPKRGTVRDDIMQGIRIIGFKRTVSVAFLVKSDAVLILGVFYGGRNIAHDTFEDRD